MGDPPRGEVFSSSSYLGSASCMRVGFRDALLFFGLPQRHTWKEEKGATGILTNGLLPLTTRVTPSHKVLQLDGLETCETN